MRKINCIYIPSLDIDDNITGYSRVVFPEVEKSIDELSNLKEYSIVCKLGTSNDLLGHTNDEPIFIRANPDLVIQEELVSSFESALNIYGYTMRR